MEIVYSQRTNDTHLQHQLENAPENVKELVKNLRAYLTEFIEREFIQNDKRRNIGILQK